MQRMLKLQKKLHVQAYVNTEKVQAQQKLQYEAKDNTSAKIAFDQKVLVQTMKNVGRKGGKLEPHFSGGPYIVAEALRTGHHCFDDANGKLLKTANNCHHLKKWFEPNAGRPVCKSVDGYPDSDCNGDACNEDAHDRRIDVHATEMIAGRESEIWPTLK